VSIGTAIFCSVVLVLLVINKPFRKVMAWIAGIGAILAAVGAGGYWVYLKHQDHIAKLEADKWAAAKPARVAECMERHRKAAAVTGWFIAPYGAVKKEDGQIDVQATCESNEFSEWTSTSAFAPSSQPLFDMSKAVPLTPSASKKSSGGGNITATIRNSCSSEGRTLWNEPDYQPERRVLRIFKGGETVEYLGKSTTDDIVRYHGLRGYISDYCVTVQEQ
jgi:hypothetical protein